MRYNFSVPPNFSIFRTPTILCKHNEAAYEPNAFSFGPFHHGKQQKFTQKVKWDYLQGLLRRSTCPEELYSQLVQAISLTKLSPDESLIQLALKFFSNIFSSYPPSVAPNQSQDIEIKHILDLLRHLLLIPLSSGKFEGEPTEWEPIPCATKMNKAGIKFTKAYADSILDINFKNGVLEIPPLSTQETTETILRNLISFEQSYPSYLPIVTSYVMFMGNLIDTEKDVEILSEHDIIDNWLYPEDLKQFFKKLYHGAYAGTSFILTFAVK
ncbi:hypothetical protein Patl1_02997 [Pistacia atlantica]|uniref:Uncharacterized protein n=1 Tax=Pistacia atlantica TaxID=434234 RepID=A0ACC1C605_9ROSI|nr:hypothetical protein Patl1_02997 [Pistacia atlantica]